MRKIVCLVAAALAFVLVAYSIANYVTVHNAVHARVNAAPFTLEQWSYGGDGKIIERRTTAQRSDGTLAIVGSYPGQPDAGSFRRIHRPDGFATTMWDKIRGKSSGYMTAGELARWKADMNPPANCAAPYEAAERTEQVHGQEAWVVVRTIDPPGAVRSKRVTEWRVHRLHCLAIRTLIEDFIGGNWVTKVDARPIALLIGEPDPAYFAAGDGYRELAPSKAMAEYRQANPLPAGACPTCPRAPAGADDVPSQAEQDAKLDEAYRRRQVKP